MNQWKQLREAVKLTQRQVATELGVNEVSVSSWETGRNNPGVGKLLPLAALYKVPVTRLIDVCTQNKREDNADATDQTA